MRLIESEITEKKVKNTLIKFGIKNTELCRIIDCIRTSPTVDAEPVVHAHWEYHRDGIPFCSRCGDEALSNRRYCPSCGAKMDGE